MIIFININNSLSKYFIKTGIVEIEVDEGATIKDILKTLSDIYGTKQLVQYDITNEHDFRKFFLIVLGSELASLTDKVFEANKVIKLLPPLSGG